MLKKLNNYLAYRLLRRLPLAALQQVIEQVVQERTRQLAPADALRFLFSLEETFYQWEGRLSKAYNDGVHTKHRHTNYHDFFVEHITADDYVIDIGCGPGVLAQDIATRTGASVVGIDINARSIAIARERFTHPNVQYKVGDALEYLPDQSFDVIVLSNVLEHLPDRSQFLVRATQQTGAQRLLIRVPLFEREWRVPLKKELGMEWRLDPTHETEYTLEQFEREIDEAGLTIVTLKVHWGEIFAEIVRGEHD